MKKIKKFNEEISKNICEYDVHRVKKSKVLKVSNCYKVIFKIYGFYF